MENFPDDVRYNILSFLPLKSVIQFSCVCKSWLSIIRGPTFRELNSLHFVLSEPEPAILIITYDVIGENKVMRISYMKHEGLELSVCLTPVANIVSPYSWSLVGTCDGLLCFATSGIEETIMVCNPVTKEHVILPKPSRSTISHNTKLAFGFDSITKKYKVVRLLCDRDICSAAQVYAVGDAGSWREVQGYNRAPSGRPVYAKGSIYWLVDTGNHHHYPIHQFHAHQQERILSFDLGKEEFRMVQHIRIGIESSLVELGESLAVVDSSSITLVEVSVMDDSSPNSWKKEYILPVRNTQLLERRSPRLICAREHDGVLLIWLQHGLISYKRKGFVRRDLKLKRFPIEFDWEICSCFRGSFIWPFSAAAEDHTKTVRFASNQEVYSMLEGILDFKQDAARGCESIVNCFKENGLLSR